MTDFTDNASIEDFVFDKFSPVYPEFDPVDLKERVWAVRMASDYVSPAIPEERRETAIGLLAAHFLERKATQVAEASTRIAGVSEGETISATTGGVSPTSQDILALTVYGQQYLTYFQVIRPPQSYGFST